MKYYRSGSSVGTIYLRWNPFPNRLKGIFTANENIGKMWMENYEGCPGRCDIYKYASVIQGTYVKGNLNTIRCCGPIPSAGGKLQYRAYNCQPQSYKQLMSGILINPKTKWSDIRKKLNLNSSSSCERISVIAFFIPSERDRNIRKLKATYSVARNFWLCPPCSANIWGSGCPDAPFSDRPLCNCPPNQTPLYRCP
jgi:hypothetical protein